MHLIISACNVIMEKLKIDNETVKEIYIIYDEKHKFLEILHIDTDIKKYLAENKNAKYYEKMTIEDIVVYENDTEEFFTSVDDISDDKND